VQIPKPSEAKKEAFAAAAVPIRGAIVMPMFGNLGAFVNGNMFAGLLGPDLGVRLTDASAAAELAAIPGTAPFGPAERPMGGYISLPSGWLERPGLVAKWLDAAFEQVATLPPRAVKPRKR
jgi:TfoX/Sxy family transcriptional regulator of competence genes